MMQIFQVVVFGGLVVLMAPFVRGQEAVQWVRSLGGTGGEHAISIALDHRGSAYLVMNSAFGLIRVGSTQIDNRNGVTVILTKFRPDGETAWTGYITSTLAYDVNGEWLPNTGTVHPQAKVVSDTDGFAYLAGTFSGMVRWMGPNGKGEAILRARGKGSAYSLPSDIFLLKISADGELVWARTYGGPISESFMDLSIRNQTLALSGNALGAGRFGPFPTTNENAYGHQWVAACDLDSTVRWVRQVPSTQTDYGAEVGVGQGGAVHIATIFNTPGQIGTNTIAPPVSAVLIRFDPGGRMTGVTPIAASVEALTVDALGSTYLTGTLARDNSGFSGTVDNLTISGSYHRYIAKVDREGNAKWGAANGVAELAIGPDGVYGTGMVGLERRFDSGVLRSGFQPDAFVGRWSVDGAAEWGAAYADNGDEEGTVLAVDHSGDAWMAGQLFSRNARSRYGVSYFGDADVFIARFKRATPIVLPPPHLGLAETDIPVRTNGTATVRIISDVPVRTNLLVRLAVDLRSSGSEEVVLELPAGSQGGEIELADSALVEGGIVTIVAMDGDHGATLTSWNTARLHAPGLIRFASNSLALDPDGTGRVVLQRPVSSAAPIRGGILDLTRGLEVGRFWFPPGETNTEAEVHGVLGPTTLSLTSDEALVEADHTVKAVVPPVIVQWCCLETGATLAGEAILRIEAEWLVRETVIVSGEFRSGTIVKPFSTTIPRGSRTPDIWPRITDPVLAEIGGEVLLTQIQPDTVGELGDRRSLWVRPLPTVSFSTRVVQVEAGGSIPLDLVLSAPFPEPVFVATRRWIQGVPEEGQIHRSIFQPNETRRTGYVTWEPGVSVKLERYPLERMTAKPSGITQLEVITLPATVNVPAQNGALPGETLNVPFFLHSAVAPVAIRFQTEPGTGVAGQDFPPTNGLVTITSNGELLLPIPSTARPGSTFKLLLSTTDAAVLTSSNLLFVVRAAVSLAKDAFIVGPNGTAEMELRLAQPLPFAVNVPVTVSSMSRIAKTVHVPIHAGQNSLVVQLPLGGIEGETQAALLGGYDPWVQFVHPSEARILPPGANAATQLIRVGSFMETHDHLVFSLQRSGPFTAPLQVRYATRDGTAIAGRDYEPATGFITLHEGHPVWGDGAFVKIRRLPVDGSEERELFLDLFDLPENVLVLGSKVGHLPAVWSGFTLDAPAVVTEGADDLEVAVVDEKAEAAFEFFTSDGTARNGIDYSAVRGMVGPDRKVRIPLASNDTRVEPVKHFILTVIRIAPERATNSVAIQIIDDESGSARDESFGEIRDASPVEEAFGGVTSDDRIIFANPSADIRQFDRTGRLIASAPFPPSEGFRAGLVQPDGRLLIGIDGTAFGQPSVIRIFPDGRLDETFRAASDQSTILGLANDGAGRVLVLKRRLLQNGWEIMRLLEDGTIDPAFQPVRSDSRGFGNDVLRFGRTSDGTIMVALETCNVWGCSYDQLLRIDDRRIVNVEKVVKPFFGSPDTRPHWFPHALPDGGTYMECIYPAGNVALGYRVRPDGTLDEHLTPGATDADGFQFLGAQQNGSIIGWGWSTDRGGLELVRLRPTERARRGISLQNSGGLSLAEGRSEEITVHRIGESSEPLEFRLSVYGGTATPQDFSERDRILRLDPWQSSLNVTLKPSADQLSEGEEWCYLQVVPLSSDAAVYGADLYLTLRDNDPFLLLALTSEPALEGYANQQDVFIIETSDDGGLSWKPIEAVRGSFRRAIQPDQYHRMYRARRNR